MDDKGQILVVSYYLPPKNHIASMRVGGICKYLSELGWDIIVLTADHPTSSNQRYNVVSSEVPKGFVKKAMDKYRAEVSSKGGERGSNEGSQIKTQKATSNLIKKKFKDVARFLRDEIVNYPDNKRLWCPNGVKQGEKIIENKKISCIISSSGPFTCHRIASQLSTKYELPWIADFRDWWTQNPYRNRTKIRTLIEKRMEIKTINPADQIITVSEPIAEDLSDLHNRNVKAILSGYDSSEYPEVSPIDTFTIIYPGQFYRGKRNPELLFEAVSNLVSKNIIGEENIEIAFYGDLHQWIADLAEQYRIRNCISARERVDKKKVLEEERRSHCLLSLHWDDKRAEGVYTGKIFEYLGAGRPIISITPPPVVEELLANTGAGESFHEVNSLEKWLHNQYHTFQESGEVVYDVNSAERSKYTQLRMAKEFEEIIMSEIGKM